MKPRFLFTPNDYSLLFVFLITLASCTGSKVVDLTRDTLHGGAQIPGQWEGKQVIKIRYKTGWFDYHFLSSDSLNTEIAIGNNGEINGKIGNARFLNAKVLENRGVIGRALNLATDYCIEGELEGALFDGDSLGNKTIMIPLSTSKSKLVGDVFQKLGMDVYPMTTIELFKK